MCQTPSKRRTDGQTRTAQRHRHAVPTSLRLVDRVKTQTHGRTNGRTDEKTRLLW